MSSNYQQKKMMNALGAIDTKGNIVLEQFQDGTALLFQPGNAQPFCVATDYDRATASWSYGKYFSDLGCAHEAADPEIIEDASVRWVREDIREKLKAREIEPTEFNVQSVIMGDSMLWERPLDRDFRDNMIASGNDDLDARVAILKENGNFKNVDTAMPVESLDDLEQYRSDRLTDKVTSLKDSLDAQYKADERGRVFDRPCQLDARFKSHDGMDLDPSTPEIESGYEFNRRSIEDDRAADDRNSISDQDIDSRL